MLLDVLGRGGSRTGASVILVKPSMVERGACPDAPPRMGMPDEGSDESDRCAERVCCFAAPRPAPQWRLDRTSISMR
eukprot:CAMPEP_0174868520 /NCGR_PEP_ID=MMETSP1114-20130205/66149_1 /TAXON_ID=312471 /ORGANISM="Neobodo designis, Strain CCAP 1951/1" /LENGTH=76 /DNA_ID=CAMNT_0016103739 /DNA_START=34 /DNA_END=261 /DNA_ORIENTATION=-